jgi:hypothetical protein
MDFYAQVPKTLRENLEYRIKLRRRAEKDAGFRRALWLACKHDILFFLSAFWFLYEPRPMLGADGSPLPSVIPFIPWDHQPPAILETKAALGKSDVGWKKSRAQGASWIADALAVHDWLFTEGATVGMCSSTEEKCDKPNDRGTLLGKIDWELTMLPQWMVGKFGTDWNRNKSDHLFVNHRMNSLIVGSASTGGTGRSHRFSWYFLDEMAEWATKDANGVLASLQYATNSRWFCSTPLGSEGAFHDIMHQPSNMLRVVLKWQDNPSQNRGLYRLDSGVPVAVSEKNPLPKSYDPPDEGTLNLFSQLRANGFRLEGKVRSPWYDGQCDRAGATPQSIAQELDMDFGGSMHQVLPVEFFTAANKSLVLPKSKGFWMVHPEKCEGEFHEDERGLVNLWCPLDIKKRPPRKQYVMGVDVSSGLAGSHTSNSVIEVIDLVAAEQVLEYACNWIEPGEWAEYAVSLCKWFHDAYLVVEQNGPGVAFIKRLKNLQYPHIYLRTVHWKGGSRQKTKEIGWHTDRKTKELLFSELYQHVKTGQLTLRSRVLVQECGQYVRLDGKIEHVRAARSKDDSSKGEAHGDRVIALGVALQGALDRPLDKKPVDERIEDLDEREIPLNCMAARQRDWEKSQKKSKDGWNENTTWGLMRQ